MKQGIGLFIYPVKDVDRAKTIFSALLGTQPYVEAKYYVGFKVGDQEIGLNPNGHAAGHEGPVGYWEVADVRQTLKTLLDAGAETQQDVKDVGGGKLTALVKDGSGNLIGIMQSP